MKSFLLRLSIFTALLACSTLAQAQFTAYGIKVGAQSTTISGSYAEPDKRHFGFSGYVFADYALNRTQAIELNLGYSRRGFYRDRVQPNPQNLQSGPARAHSTMDYLSFSSVLKLEYSRGGTRPFIGIGPRVDYLLGTDAGSFNYDDETVVEDPSVSYLKDAVLGFTASAGITQISLFQTLLRFSLN